MSYYQQIADVTRDQTVSQQASDAFNELIRRYPESRYAADARLKLDLIKDHLAGKDMEVGRFYQRSGQWLAATYRFRNVVDNIQTTQPHARSARAAGRMLSRARHSGRGVEGRRGARPELSGDPIGIGSRCGCCTPSRTGRGMLDRFGAQAWRGRIGAGEALTGAAQGQQLPAGRKSPGESDLAACADEAGRLSLFRHGSAHAETAFDPQHRAGRSSSSSSSSPGSACSPARPAPASRSCSTRSGSRLAPGPTRGWCAPARNRRRSPPRSTCPRIMPRVRLLDEQGIEHGARASR